MVAVVVAVNINIKSFNIEFYVEDDKNNMLIDNNDMIVYDNDQLRRIIEKTLVVMSAMIKYIIENVLVSFEAGRQFRWSSRS